MKYLSKIYAKFKREKILFFVAFLADTLLNLVLIHLMNILIRNASLLDLHGFKSSAFLFCGILLLFSVFLFLDQYSFRRLVGYGEIELKKHAYKCFLRNAGRFRGKHVGEAVSAINSDTAIISQWLSCGPINVIIQLAILCAYLGLMSSYNVYVTLITLAVILCVFILSKIFAQLEAKYLANQQAEYARISAALLDAIQCKTLMLQFDNVPFFEKKLNQLHNYSQEAIIPRLSKYTALRDAMLIFMTNTLPIIVFSASLMLPANNCGSIANAVSIMLVAQKLNEPIIILADLIADYRKANSVYLGLAPLYTEDSSENLGRLTQQFDRMDINIEEYRYRGAEKRLLNCVNFNISKGDVVLIKASSGSGKSTLAKLLAKLIPIDDVKGSIEYNSLPISCYDQKSYNKHVILVEQDAILIDGTLRENLLLGDAFPEALIDEVIDACALGDFVARKGANYLIRGDADNISGGERQRIGLARMLLRRPDIIILDETTSALDADTKETMISRVLTYAKNNGMTVVAISHDSSFDLYYTKILHL